MNPPPTMWAQCHNLVFITVCLEDCKSPEIRIELNEIYCKGKGGTGNKENEVTIELCKEIDPEQSLTTVKDRVIEIMLKKKGDTIGFWPQLTKEKQKFHWLNVDWWNSMNPPPTMWAQCHNLVFITVCLEDCKSPEIRIELNEIYFKGKGGTGNKENEVTIELCKEIDPEQSLTTVKDRVIEIMLKKKGDTIGFWPQLTKEKQKFHWLNVDWWNSMNPPPTMWAQCHNLVFITVCLEDCKSPEIRIELNEIYFKGKGGTGNKENEVTIELCKEIDPEQSLTTVKDRVIEIMLKKKGDTIGFWPQLTKEKQKFHWLNVDWWNSMNPPPTMWAQCHNLVFITVCLEDCKSPEIRIELNEIYFKGKGGTGNKVNEVTIELCKEIDPEQSLTTVKDRVIEIMLKKKGDTIGFWPQLTKEKQKFHWLNVDWWNSMNPPPTMWAQCHNLVFITVCLEDCKSPEIRIELNEIYFKGKGGTGNKENEVTIELCKEIDPEQSLTTVKDRVIEIMLKKKGDTIGFWPQLTKEKQKFHWLNVDWWNSMNPPPTMWAQCHNLVFITVCLEDCKSPEIRIELNEIYFKGKGGTGNKENEVTIELCNEIDPEQSLTTVKDRVIEIMLKKKGDTIGFWPQLTKEKQKFHWLNVDWWNSMNPPPTMWAQCHNLVFITVCLEDCKSPEIRIELNEIYFKGKGGTGNKENEVTIELCKEIDPEQSLTTVKDRVIEIMLKKKGDTIGFWPQLTKEKQKFHWLNVDWWNSMNPPPTMWAQCHNLVFITVCLEDCKSPEIRIELNEIYFKGKGGTGNKENEVTIELCKEIDPEQSLTTVKDRVIEIMLKKKGDTIGFWPQLTKEKQKFHWLNVDWWNSMNPPPTMWAQCHNLVFITVCLEDCKSPEIRIELNEIYFKGKGGTGNKENEVTIELCKEIDPEQSLTTVKDRVIEIMLKKKGDTIGFWPQLTKEKQKFHWLNVDWWNRWQDREHVKRPGGGNFGELCCMCPRCLEAEHNRVFITECLDFLIV